MVGNGNSGDSGDSGDIGDSGDSGVSDDGGCGSGGGGGDSGGGGGGGGDDDGDGDARVCGSGARVAVTSDMEQIHRVVAVCSPRRRVAEHDVDRARHRVEHWGRVEDGGAMRPALVLAPHRCRVHHRLHRLPRRAVIERALSDELVPSSRPWWG